MALKTNFFDSDTQIAVFWRKWRKLARIEERLRPEEITAILLILRHFRERRLVPSHGLFLLFEDWRGLLCFQDARLDQAFVVVANIVLVLPLIYSIVCHVYPKVLFIDPLGRLVFCSVIWSRIRSKIWATISRHDVRQLGYCVHWLGPFSV